MTEAQRAYELHEVGKTDEQIAMTLTWERGYGRPTCGSLEARELWQSEGSERRKRDFAQSVFDQRGSH